MQAQPTQTPRQSYDAVAKGLHWLMVVVFAALFALGFIMTDMPKGPDRYALYDVHEIVGMLALVLASVRLVWRFLHPAPQPIGEQGSWETIGAKVVHAALYALMFAVPVVGWALLSAAGHQVELGIVSIPALVGKDDALREILSEVHETLAFGFLLLIAVHAAAALKHQFVDHDLTLARMLPQRSGLLRH